MPSYSLKTAIYWSLFGLYFEQEDKYFKSSQAMNLKFIIHETNDWIFRVDCNGNIGLLNTMIEIAFFEKIEALTSGPKVQNENYSCFID